jgi:hypothetical protein
MFVVFRHGGTLQQKVLHLVFENAMEKCHLFAARSHEYARCPCEAVSRTRGDRFVDDQVGPLGHLI